MTGFELTTLGNVARWGSGGTPKRDRGEFFDGDIPWAVIGDLNDGVVTETATTITEAGLKSSSAKWIEPGSVMVAMYGSIGKLGIAGMRMTSNQAIAFARPNADVDAKYLFWYLRSIRSELHSLGRGGTQRNIGQGTLKSLPFVKPSLEEQRSVVQEIEKQFTRLDAAQRALNQAHLRCDIQASAVVRDALKPGTDWRKARLRDVVERVTVGHVGPMKHEYRPDGIPFLRSQNVRPNRFDPTGLRFVSRDFHEHLKKSALRPGDVVVVRSGAVGTACVIPEVLPEANCSDLVVIQGPREVRGEFLAHFLNSAARRQVAEGTVGVALQHFNTRSVANIELDIPPLEEQDRIVSHIDALLSDLAEVRRSIGENLARVTTLRRALLSMAFSEDLQVTSA